MRAVSRQLGLTERKVRELMRAGHLEPVDVDIGRVVRWVTAESVEAYVNRATRAGEYALRLCSRCQGIRYVQAGSDTCGLCADRVAEQALEQAEARRTRKRAWWADNGPAWRARKASREQQSTQPKPRSHE